LTFWQNLREIVSMELKKTTLGEAPLEGQYALKYLVPTDKEKQLKQPRKIYERLLN
jgi:hypothetical protein